MSQVIQLNDRWLQDEFAQPWTDGSSRSEWKDGIMLMSAVLADGGRVSATSLPGSLDGLCDHPVPDRALEINAFWSDHKCRLMAGHDCPHVAVTQNFSITSFSIQRDRGPFEPRRYDYPLMRNLDSVV